MKNIRIGLAGLLVVGLAACQLQTTAPAEMPITQEKQVLQPQSPVTLMIDFGDRVATYSSMPETSSTVLSVLKSIAEREQFILETKTYDFGTLVDSIGGKVNNNTRAWIYYVNGKSGEVGAQEKRVSWGDVIEWKYIPPIY